MSKDSSPPQSKVELSRELSLFHITMMGVGMMIGAGVFLGVGNSIRVAGPGGVLLTFALNGMLATFTAMAYAELSSAIPKAGGAYNFARVGFGRGTSFLAGWMEWFASSIAGSIYALTFAIYTLHYLSQLGLLNWLPLPIRLAEKILGVVIASFFMGINYRGASKTGKTGAFFTLGQTITLAFIGLAGIMAAIKEPSRLLNFQPFLPQGYGKLLITMGFTYVAFEGFEVIAQTGDEAIEPRRNIPKAMLYSILIVVSTYLLVAFAAIVGVKSGSPGIEGPVWAWIGSYGEKGFAMAVSRLMPAGGGFLVTLAVIFAATSALNATIYSATRASYALGRDRMLPQAFSLIAPKYKTPYMAIIFTAVIVITVTAFLPTLDVASSASIMFLFLFFLVNICVIKIRRDMGDELTYGFIMPFFPILPLIAILCQGILAIWLIHMSWLAWVVAPAWILAGVVIYHTYSKKHALTTQEEIVVLEEERAPEGDEYRIMVPVANPQNALSLIWYTFKLCGAKKARVNLLHMVPVPEMIPLSDADKYIVTGKEAITEAMLYLTEFPITTTIRYCRNVARGIVMATRENKIDMLIMGWHGKKPSHRHDFVFGSTLDPVVEKAPCNVIILKDCPRQAPKRVLLPFAGGPNSTLALEIASILIDKKEGEITILNVTQPGKPTQDIEAFLGQSPEFRRKKYQRLFTPKYIVSKNIASAILQEAQEYDLVVIGTSQVGMFQQMLLGSIPEEVARKCERPLVIVKASKGVRFLIKRWI